jgi:hypothetical protein
MSTLECAVVVIHRPDGETIVVESKKPFRELIQLVQEVPGSEGVVAVAVRSPLRTRVDRLRGPTFGEWRIEAYASTETDMLRAAE